MVYSKSSEKDTVNGPRGIGIKIFGVSGEFLDGSEGHTQDTFFNSAQPLELRCVLLGALLYRSIKLDSI